MLRGLYVRVGGRRGAESQKQRKRRNEMDGRFQKIAAKKVRQGSPHATGSGGPPLAGCGLAAEDECWIVVKL